MKIKTKTQRYLLVLIAVQLLLVGTLCLTNYFKNSSNFITNHYDALMYFHATAFGIGIVIVIIAYLIHIDKK